MSVHAPHRDVATDGLADGCPRCDEQAHRPFENLDRELLADLLHRVKINALPRSLNERIAMNVVKDVLWRAEVLASLEAEPLASRKAPVA